MTKRTTTPTRVHADIAACAVAVAPSEHRTFAEQVNYWARIGMQIERSGSIDHRRVLAAAAGTAQFSTLDQTERSAAHALIDARISERAMEENFGAAARVAGHNTVYLDDDGNLVEVSAGGVSRLL